MNVEVFGTQFVNKGAQLMLLTVMQQLKRIDPAITVVHTVRPRQASLFDILSIGAQPKSLAVEYRDRRVPVVDVVARKLQAKYGFVREHDIDCLLDASGFAYGDQWNAVKMKKRARDYARWSRHGVRIILMPQAFGPFNQPASRRAIRSITKCVRLLFARDPVSYQHVLQAVPASLHHKVILSPDMTVGADPVPYRGEIPGNFFLSPNEKVVAKAGIKTHEYIELVREAVNTARRIGMEPFFLLHETRGDRHICEQVNTLLEKPLPIVEEQDPLQVKWIIGRCQAGFSSRFHGLVNALSQGVPVIGLGWSHKYTTLFDSFDFTAGLVHTTQEISASLTELSSRENRAMVSGRLLAAAASQKQQLNTEVWDRVREVLNATS